MATAAAAAAAAATMAAVVPFPLGLPDNPDDVLRNEDSDKIPFDSAKKTNYFFCNEMPC